MDLTHWTPESKNHSEKSHTFNFTLSFNKEDNNNWYVDIPYNGPHWDLRMVSGADSFLEVLANGSRRVTVQFCDHIFKGCDHQWHVTKRFETYGRTYEVVSDSYKSYSVALSRYEIRLRVFSRTYLYQASGGLVVGYGVQSSLFFSAFFKVLKLLEEVGMCV